MVNSYKQDDIRKGKRKDVWIIYGDRICSTDMIAHTIISKILQPPL